jgi:hypothetical protein
MPRERCRKQNYHVGAVVLLPSAPFHLCVPLYACVCVPLCCCACSCRACVCAIVCSCVCLCMPVCAYVFLCNYLCDRLCAPVCACVCLCVPVCACVCLCVQLVYVQQHVQQLKNDVFGRATEALAPQPQPHRVIPVSPLDLLHGSSSGSGGRSVTGGLAGPVSGRPPVPPSTRVAKYLAAAS